MKKQLTISIAAYNVEAYLDHLMRSIIKADAMEQIEVLIINDGSKDRTADIAQKYQDLYPQSVRHINKPNGGHGSTINRGIEEATGRYFRALDGDDWVNPEQLVALINRIESINADIILSEYSSCYENGEEKQSDEFPELEDGKQYQFEEIWHPGFWMRYHTVIYRTELLRDHHIHLDEHSFYVDVEFMLYLIPYISTIYYNKNYIYCYRVGSEGQSVSYTNRMKNIDHSETVAKSLIDYFQEHKNDLSREKKNYIVDEICGHCKWHEVSLLLFPSRKEKKKMFVAFEQYIQIHAPEVYKQMSRESKVLRVLRKTRYHTYKLAAIYIKLDRKRKVS